MKVLTVFGTRPEVIRLSQTIRCLDGLCTHLLLHTGQNYDPQLSNIFFSELGVRSPDLHLGIRAATFADQVGALFSAGDAVLAEHRPDRLLILGDTNSGLLAIAAARRGIPVFHLEAGNRCYDDRVPEEINRRVIDHTSTVLLPYTHRSMENLVAEGVPRRRIYVVGNPIFEVMQAHASEIAASNILARLGLAPQEYFAATLHRSENVDQPDRLRDMIQGLSLVANHYGAPLVVSVHPRTADKLQRFNLAPQSANVRLLPPMGFFDFVHLEQHARGVLTDSGTVQEECCILGIPSVTIRDVTERPEAVEAGSSILSGGDPANILHAMQVALGTPSDWQPPREYLQPLVSRTVAKIVLGFRWTG